MKILTALLLVIGTLLIVAIVLALPVMWLWNYLMPDIFGLIKIDFWQALCLNLLCGVLFKSSSSSSKD